MGVLERAFAMKIQQGLIVASENDTILHICSLMQKHNIGAILIVNGEDLVGIVSERDVVSRVVANKRDPANTFAKQIMTREVVTADMDEGLNKIYEILATVPFRHLPVTKANKLVGIVSKRDILFSMKPKQEDSIKQ